MSCQEDFDKMTTLAAQYGHERNEAKAEIVRLTTALQIAVSKAEILHDLNDALHQRAKRRTDKARAAIERIKAMHQPFTDDGVTYCGWDHHGGCGEVWPCPTIHALDALTEPASELEREPDAPSSAIDAAKRFISETYGGRL